MACCSCHQPVVFQLDTAVLNENVNIKQKPDKNLIILKEHYILVISLI